MRTILLPFHDEHAGQTALSTAALVARRFGSYLEGLLVMGEPHVRFAPGMAVPSHYLSEAAAEWRQFADKSREHFLESATALEMASHELESNSTAAAVAWREMEGRESDIVGSYGRLFDLIVMGRTHSAALAGWRETCEGALFESGRPVLLAPRVAPNVVGNTIIVSWNGSTEAARTVSFGMPFLTTAESVIVLTVDEAPLYGPTGEELCKHLKRADVPAEARTVAAGDRSIGDTILEETYRENATLLLKGAFTRSRFRQVVFGGPTEHVLENADVPVLMAH